MSVYQLAYLSQSSYFSDQQSLSQLLQQSRHANQQRDVTGILLYHQQHFFQVLEGNKPTVEVLYQKILNDPRHRGCRKMAIFETERRDFDAWRMAFCQLDDDDPLLQQGFMPLLKVHHQDDEPSADSVLSVRSLISQFKQRMQIDLLAQAV